MTLRNIIDDKYKEAVRSKNSSEIKTLRLVKSAIKDKDIAARSVNNNKGIQDSEILSLLQNLIKQRKDSIDSFNKASRSDLVSIEQAEIDIISNFLPKQMTDDETETLIIEVIKKNNFNSLKDMGILMKNLKSDYSGTVDMAVAGKIAKSQLSN